MLEVEDMVITWCGSLAVLLNKLCNTCIEERLPEEESIAQVRAAFAAAHVYIDSPSAKDLEYIRIWFIRWKQQ